MASEKDRSLSQKEIDSLLSSFDQGEVEVSTHEEHAKKVVPYDFKRPERIARDQLRAIETLHEVFCRNVQAVISGWLRTILDIRVSSVDQLTYAEFINSLPNPTCFNVLSCEPLEGNFILEVNPVVAFMVIERLLGSAKGSTSLPERPLTDLEWKLVDRIISRFLTGLQEVWASISNVTFKVTGRESNPQLMPIMPPNEPVVAVAIEFSMGEYKGHVNVCIPVMSVENIMDKISTHTWFVKKKDSGVLKQETITETLAGAQLTLSAFFLDHYIKIGDLQSLQVGDIIVTSHHEQDPLTICVESKPKYLGIIGSIKEKRAVRVIRKLDKKELSASEFVKYVSVLKEDKGSSEQKTEAEKNPMINNIISTHLSSPVILAEKNVSLNDVLNLKQGIILEFTKSINEPLELEVGKVRIAKGTIVKIGERFGFQATNFTI